MIKNKNLGRLSEFIENINPLNFDGEDCVVYFDALFNDLASELSLVDLVTHLYSETEEKTSKRIEQLKYFNSNTMLFQGDE